jgi:hypothetical protein
MIRDTVMDMDVDTDTVTEAIIDTDSATDMDTIT